MASALLWAALLLTAVPQAAVSARPAGSDLVSRARDARRAGDLATARRLYEEALHRDPDNGPVALALAETLVDMGESRPAEELLVRLVRSLPERPEPRRALVRAYLQNGKKAEALAEAGRALELDPDNPEGHLSLASALMGSARVEEAIAEFEKAAKGLPRDVRLLHGLAIAYASLGDPNARTAFERALATAPGNLQVRLDFVRYLWLVRDFDRGDQEMEQILRAAPSNRKLRAEYASNLMDQERFREAARELERIWKDGTRDYDVAFSLGTSLGQTERFDEAEKKFREAIAIAPDKLPARHVLGRLLLLRQRPEEAAAELERAAALQPDSAGVQLDLGRAYEAAKKLDQAEAAYRAALKADPTLTKAHYTLGTLLARTGHREEAAQHIAIYQEAFRKEQEAALGRLSQRAELNLGWFELRRGEPQKALERFERHSDDPDALRGAARALVQLGRRAEALQKYERAVALSPEDASLRYELDREYDRRRRE